MQAIDGLEGAHARAVFGPAFYHPAGDAVETDFSGHIADRLGVRWIDHHHRPCVAGVEDIDAPDRRFSELALRSREHWCDGGERRFLARGRAGDGAGRKVAVHGGHVRPIARHNAPGQVDRRQRQQAGERDHDVKGQGQDAQRIMAVEPAALPLGWAKGEDVLEDAFVRDDARYQRDQHHHGGERREQSAPWIGQFQFEMKAVEKLPAQRFARDRRAAYRIERAGEISAITVIGRLHHILMGMRGGQIPAGGTLTIVFQPAGCRDDRICRAGDRSRFRAHPAANFVLEDGQRAGETHDKQHMAQQQPGPAMQPGHGLARAVANCRRRRSSHAGCPAAQAPIASRPAMPATPASARHGPDARKAQMVTAGATG